MLGPSHLARHLGLAISPLFKSKFVADGEHFAMLDGRRASFACSTGDHRDVSVQSSKDWQWSADLAHHVLIGANEIEVRSGRGPSRRFALESVEKRLEDFVAFLSAQRPGLPDVVPFLIREFRDIWGTTTRQDGQSALAAFLLSLQASEQDADVLSDPVWCKETAVDIGLDPDMVDGAITHSTIVRAQSIQSRAERFGVRLIPSLVLRHAAGRLFQEAHAVLESQQFGLFGDSTITIVPNYSPSGAYYTPVPIARMLAEWAVRRWTDKDGNITIADFACGSGVFLTEALRALERNGFRGTVNLLGRDKSAQAIVMAKVAIRAILRDSDLRVSEDFSVADAFSEAWPQADIVLMNPPFRSWERMNSQERDWVHELVGGIGRGRPDLSVGFVEKAMGSVKRGGVVATLVPAGVLGSDSLGKWRGSLANRATPTLVAVLGEHGLFQHALVNIGIVALEDVGNTVSRPSNPQVHVAWSSADVGSSSKTVRAVRRSLFEPDFTAGAPSQIGWSLGVTSLAAWMKRPSWLPGAGALGSLLELIQTRVPTTVGSLFHVHQGIRTGANEVFVRTEVEINDLPSSERVYFRWVVDTPSFVNGVIEPRNMLFVPDPNWRDEAAVRSAVPEFFNRYLKTGRDSLLSRKSLVDGRWWQLTRPRGWMFNGRARLVSKRFGLYPAFARDYDGAFAIVQANAWLPGEILTTGQDRTGLRETLTSYWWFLNSRVFIAILREYCPNVAGGQLDLENKYVKNVPIPNFVEQFRENPALRQIAISMRTNYAERLPRTADLDRYAAAAYGTDISEWNLAGLEYPDNES